VSLSPTLSFCFPLPFSLLTPSHSVCPSVCLPSLSCTLQRSALDRAVYNFSVDLFSAGVVLLELAARYLAVPAPVAAMLHPVDTHSPRDVVLPRGITVLRAMAQEPCMQLLEVGQRLVQTDPRARGTALGALETMRPLQQRLHVRGLLCEVHAWEVHVFEGGGLTVRSWQDGLWGSLPRGGGECKEYR
jgi:hypothetical protein